MKAMQANTQIHTNSWRQTEETTKTDKDTHVTGQNLAFNAKRIHTGINSNWAETERDRQWQE